MKDAFLNTCRYYARAFAAWALAPCSAVHQGVFMRCLLLLMVILLLAVSAYCYEVNIGPFIPMGLFCDDLNRDGNVDLLVPADNFNMHILHNNGDGTFSNAFTLPISRAKSFTQKLYDFNNDGYTDIDGFFRTTDEDGNRQTTFRIYFSDAGYFYENYYIDLPPMTQSNSVQVLYGDWSGDGFTDAMVWHDGMYHFVLNNGGMDFTITDETLPSVGWVALRDIDADGTDEIIISTQEGLHIYKYPKLDAPFLVLPNDSYFRTIEVEDMDIDGDLDIFTSWCDGVTHSAVCIYENVGDYNYVAHNSIYYDGRVLDTSLLRHLTNDQYLDIVNYARISPYNPDGYDFPESLSYLLPAEAPQAHIYYKFSGFDYVDVDNNGFLDFVLVWLQGGARLRVYYNDGMGGFSDDPVSNNDELIPNPEIEMAIYPNPWVEKVNIEFTPCSTGEIVLNIYNIKGQLVRSFRDAIRAGNPHRIQWDGNDENGKSVSKGVYLCKINEVNNRQIVKKLIKM